MLIFKLIALVMYYLDYIGQPAASQWWRNWTNVLQTS